MRTPLRDPFAKTEARAVGWERRALSGLATNRAIVRLWVLLVLWLVISGAGFVIINR
jgi:hypothetical protein